MDDRVVRIPDRRPIPVTDPTTGKLHVPDEEKKRTPCGYPAGGLTASDGTRYIVQKNGQILRADGGGMSKKEKKQLKREAKRERRH